MKNTFVRFFAFAAMVCGVFFLANCGGSTTTSNNTTANTATTNTTKPAATTSPATDATKTDTTASTDSVGVPECDEYIKKYEACLTKIAAKAPQVEENMKTAFKAQRDGFKQAAANPASKAQLPSTCKQAMETAKQATSTYACEW